jgi:hypothetical protein
MKRRNHEDVQSDVADGGDRIWIDRGSGGCAGTLLRIGRLLYRLVREQKLAHPSTRETARS